MMLLVHVMYGQCPIATTTTTTTTSQSDHIDSPGVEQDIPSRLAEKPKLDRTLSPFPHAYSNCPTPRWGARSRLRSSLMCGHRASSESIDEYERASSESGYLLV